MSLNEALEKLDTLNIGATELAERVEAFQSGIEEISQKLDDPRPVRIEFHAAAGASISATPTLSAGPTAGSIAQVQVVLRHETQPVTKEDLEDLRKGMMLTITGQGAIRHTQPLAKPEASIRAASHLAEAEKSFLNLAIRHDLTSHPRTFSEAMTYMADDPCDCRPVNTFWMVGGGWLSWRHKMKRRHNPGCRYSRIDGRSWKPELSLQLMPFLRKTIQIGFGVATGGGGFQLEFPFKVFPTVKRSESYIFQMFDYFPRICNAKLRTPDWIHNPGQNMFITQWGAWSAGFDWDPPRCARNFAP